jgi:hypothetical protein
MSISAPPGLSSLKRRDTHFWQSHLTRKRGIQDTRIYPYPGPQYAPVPGREELPHVLSLFPPQREPITALWSTKKTRATLREYERVYPWVFEEGRGDEVCCYAYIHGMACSMVLL